MIRNKYVACALYVVLTIVFYNVLDFVHKTFIAGGGYQFTLSMDLITPVLIGVCLYFLTAMGK